MTGPAHGGAARAAPALLCDGLGCDGFVWSRLRRDLVGRPVLHPHYRGHGRTPLPEHAGRLAISDLADDMVAVLDDVGLGRAVLFGHSMGVQVALETYRRHPNRVAGMVLVCGASSNPLRTFRGNDSLEKLLPDLERWILSAPRAVNRLKRMLVPTQLAFEVAAELEINRDLLDPADFMPYLEGLARIDVRLFLALLAEAARHTADDLLEVIDVPTLVIGGGKDGFTPPERSRAIAEAIPGAELLLIDTGTHTTPLEHPDAVREVVTRFLSSKIDPIFF